jgi:hypothetical protein
LVRKKIDQNHRKKRKNDGKMLRKKECGKEKIFEKKRMKDCLHP